MSKYDKFQNCISGSNSSLRRYCNQAIKTVQSQECVFTLEDIEKAVMINLDFYLNKPVSFKKNQINNHNLDKLVLKMIKFVQLKLQSQMQNQIKEFQKEIMDISQETLFLRLLSKRNKQTRENSYYFMKIQQQNTRLVSELITLKVKNKGLKQSILNLNHAYQQCKKYYQQQIQTIKRNFQWNRMTQSQNQPKIQQIKCQKTSFSHSIIGHSTNQCISNSAHTKNTSNVIELSFKDKSDDQQQRQYENYFLADRCCQENIRFQQKIDEFNKLLSQQQLSNKKLKDEMVKMKRQMQQNISKKNILIEKLMKRIQDGPL